jgi:hypothetical protein
LVSLVSVGWAVVEPLGCVDAVALALLEAGVGYAYWIEATLEMLLISICRLIACLLFRSASFNGPDLIYRMK